MSLEKTIFKGVSWMAFFSSFGQALSWFVTILVARILVPADYGLMSMATVITGYALSLSELGLGNAVIQRQNVTEKQLSSVFWFVTAISVALAISCVPLSYLTAHVMREPRVIPIAQAVSLMFLLTGLQVIPSSLLRKRMDFKSVGLVDVISVFTASVSMLVIARSGGGVWTLLLGSVIRAGTRALVLFGMVDWRPRMHFDFRESRSFLSYGVNIALGRSLFYVQERSDRFFAGRAWKPDILGYYTVALELAQIPADKIVTLINNVSFPAFSQVQDDPVRFARLYLNIAKVTAVVNLPLFMGGFIFGDDLIRLVLNPNWYPMIFVFRMLCLAQILTNMNAINNFVHAAQGRPQWSLYYHLCCVICMPASFAVAAESGLNAMVVPWLSTYAVLCIGWVLISLRKLGITVSRYASTLSKPVLATGIMSVVMLAANDYVLRPYRSASPVAFLPAGVAGVAAYAAFFWLFDREYLFSLRRLTASVDTKARPLTDA